MSATDFVVVRVAWHGPLEWRGESGPIQPGGEIARLLAGPGLYQVYARHPVQGDNTLLYLGAAGSKATGDAATIAARLAAHWKRWAQHEDHSALLVHVGAPSVFDKGQEAPVTPELLEQVEALSIWWHSPPYNVLSTAFTRSRSPDGRRLLVQSWGARGKLAVEYSNVWDLANAQINDETTAREAGESAPNPAVPRKWTWR